jgi:TRAP-type C4-dicarboxylate transport system permease small subunit
MMGCQGGVWTGMERLERILLRTESIIKMFGVAGALAIIFILLLICLDILGRSVFGIAIQGAAEISEYLLVVLAFFGLGYAELGGIHVKVEILSSRSSPRVQKIVDILILLLVTAFFIVMTWQIGKETVNDWQRKVSQWGMVWLLPAWPKDFIAFLGCSMLVVSFLIRLLRSLLGIPSKQNEGI